MMDSYLGKSAQNLGHLFDYINRQQCVVMLDELDSLAIKRKYQDGGASAEISRTTTCLLQLLDSVTNDHIILAATNLQDSIDPAVKRRFTEKHEIRRLSKDDRRSFIIQFLTATDFSYDSQSLEEYIKTDCSQAEIMTHITRCIADMLLGGKDEVIL